MLSKFRAAVTVKSAVTPARFHATFYASGGRLGITTVTEGREAVTWTVPVEDAVALRDWLNAHVVNTAHILP